jgi:hypothetical protein
MRDQRFLTPEHYALLQVAGEVETLLETLASTRLLHRPKPID